jgi:Skp family chaperone for outer membrane proteins
MKRIVTSTAIVCLLILTACGDKKEEKKSDEPTKVAVKSVGPLTIAFFQQDSIASNFSFYVETQKTLEGKKAKIDAKVAVQQKAYENAAYALQSGMQSNSLSQNQAEGFQRKMAQCEQEVMRIQQTELASFEQESFEANTVLMNKIEAYAKDFSEKNNIKLFLSKAVGGQILYLDPQFDMTSDFINYMNNKEDELNAEIAK